MNIKRSTVYKLIILLIVLIIAACLTMVSRIGDELHHCLTNCSAYSVAEVRPLRIATLNTLHGYPSFTNLGMRFELIAKELDKHKLDIVFLQEIPWKKEIGLAVERLNDQMQLNYVYIRANGNYQLIRFEEGLAIFSRFPLRDPKFTEIFPRSNIFEHRAALAVIADTPYGPINLITTHLSWSKKPEINEAQIESLKLFINTLETHTTILGGDFNAHENSRQIRVLSENWIDVYRQKNPKVSGETCCLNHELIGNKQAGRFFVRADYIFLKQSEFIDWKLHGAKLIFDEPVEHKGHTQWLSNHRGVYTEIEINKRELEHTIRL